MRFGETGISLTPSLRFDWHKYTPKNSAGFASNSGNAFGLPDANDGFRVSPKVLAKYDVNENLGVFAQWAMTYRAPTVNELYSNFSNFGHGYARLGNDDLKAETGHGFEVGAEYSDADFSARASAFHNKYSNFINAKTINPYVLPNGQNGQLFTQENLDSVDISGVELQLRKEFANGFFAHGSLAYAYGKDTNTKLAIRTVAPFKSIVGLGYAEEQWGAELTGIFTAAMRDDNKATTFDAAGYGLFNLTGWWEPVQTKGLRIQAGVYNVFDKTYYNAVGVRDINPNTAVRSRFL
jgi:hemoglobin/transferrin/lactoferrin receptor protein